MQTVALTIRYQRAEALAHREEMLFIRTQLKLRGIALANERDVLNLLGIIRVSNVIDRDGGSVSEAGVGGVQTSSAAVRAQPANRLARIGRRANKVKISAFVETV